MEIDFSRPFAYSINTLLHAVEERLQIFEDTLNALEVNYNKWVLQYLQQQKKDYEIAMYQIIQNWYGDYKPEWYSRREDLYGSYDLGITEEGVSIITPGKNMPEGANGLSAAGMYEMIYIHGAHGGAPNGGSNQYRRGFTSRADGKYYYYKGNRGWGKAAAYSDPLQDQVVSLQSSYSQVGWKESLLEMFRNTYKQTGLINT